MTVSTLTVTSPETAAAQRARMAMKLFIFELEDFRLKWSIDGKVWPFIRIFNTATLEVVCQRLTLKIEERDKRIFLMEAEAFCTSVSILYSKGSFESFHLNKTKRLFWRHIHYQHTDPDLYFCPNFRKNLHRDCCCEYFAEWLHSARIFEKTRNLHIIAFV